MDPVFIHLRVNHFPIILIFVGCAASVLALILRRDAIWRYALVTVLLAGLSAPVAYYSGRSAEDVAEGHEMIDHRMMGEHEDSATFALVALLAAGLASAVALVKPHVGLRVGAVVLSLGAAGATLYTSQQAGKIVHNDMTVGAPEGGGSHESDDDD